MTSNEYDRVCAENKRLISEANSWNQVWNKFKDNEDFKEVEEEVIKDGNYGCATMIITWIGRLLEFKEEYE